MRILTLSLLTLSFYLGQSQGISFSYLIPTDGYLSAPVSPFSIRGLGIGGRAGFETGATLYQIPGLAMSGLPFQAEQPLVGPYFAMLIPGELYFKIPLKSFQIKLMAGGFLWWNINPRINEGNMDRAFRNYEGWQVLNTDFEMENKLGFGLMGGIEFKFELSKSLSLIAETQYLDGSSSAPLSGSYIGGNSGDLRTEEVDINDSSILLRGVEISIGVEFSK